MSDRSELRTAALAAEACLLIESARLYGLLEGGPAIDVDRCEDLIAEGRQAGITFTEDEISDAACGMAVWHNQQPRPPHAPAGTAAPARSPSMPPSP